MSFFAKTLRSFVSDISSLAQPSPGLLEAFRVVPTASGKIVDRENAMTVSAFFCAINLRANTLAKFPFEIRQRRSDGGYNLLTDHPLYTLFNLAPNGYMDANVYKRIAQNHLDLEGNHYALIDRDLESGAIVAL
ncbi:MAG TPA: phage portal protein, partial [Chroococcales cyanobacterium]